MKAPEFPNDLRWFNSPPLLMKALREEGKVVLVDFWTYSCVNCIRTLPYIKEWHTRYKDKGLVIIGIHTPEFEFEKDVSNVERALKAFSIEYPVVMDSDYEMWSRYANSFWPRKYLISHEGHIVYDHAGEGAYAETEKAIQEALKTADASREFPEPTQDEGAGGARPDDSVGRVCYPTTDETYLGSLRGRPGHEWNVKGAWKIHPEYTEHEEKQSDFKDSLELKFKAAEVNVVAEYRGEGTAKIKLVLDNAPPKELEIKEARMYRLAEGEYREGVLRIYAKDPGVRFYAFTFGGCATPPTQNTPDL